MVLRDHVIELGYNYMQSIIFGNRFPCYCSLLNLGG